MTVENKFPNGLAAAMRRAGLEGAFAELGRKISKPRQYIERWAKGITQLPPPMAEALAPHVKATPEELIFPNRPSIRKIPLYSWISAGVLAQPRTVLEASDVLDWLTLGVDQKGDWFALRVEGDSMDRISPPESIILVNRRDKRLVPNACYVIEDPETGAATYKRYRPSPARWEAVSNNPKHEPLYISGEQDPAIIGRVRRTILDM